MRRAFLIGLIAVIPGCALFDHGDPVLRELNKQREMWIAANVHEYVVDFRRSCFCTLEGTQPVNIFVQADTIYAVRNRDTGVDVRAQNDWPTVNDLFDMIADYRSRGYKLTVTYHSLLHYPTKIVGDYPGTVDDEFVDTLGEMATPFTFYR